MHGSAAGVFTKAPSEPEVSPVRLTPSPASRLAAGAAACSSHPVNGEQKSESPDEQNGVSKLLVHDSCSRLSGLRVMPDGARTSSQPDAFACDVGFDDDVDIPQLVAQNRDAHRERDEEREEGEDGTTKLGEEHEEGESRMTD